MSNQKETRSKNRSRQPKPPEFKKFMGANWGARPTDGYERSEAAPFASAQRERLGKQFTGIRLVVPTGALVTRNNDCDYYFRPHSAFARLTGLGTDRQPNAMLVLDPATKDPADGGATHTATIYFRPRASRQSEEFYANVRYGELWVGVHPSLEGFEHMSGIHCEPLDTFPETLTKNVGEVDFALVATSDTETTDLVNQIRQKARQGTEPAVKLDEKLEETLSELRLRKDSWEIGQMRRTIAATKEGFGQAIRSFPRVCTHFRGERVIEGAFGARVRELDNGLGYDTIVASGEHAATSHWIVNDGVVRDGDVVLMDAGVELDSLYTADITRTMPINGRFIPVQRRIYQAVLDAADAAFERANQPGCIFAEVHEAAMEVIAKRLDEWDFLPVSWEESLESNGQYHRRWTVYGTSHHLGLDVHDCTQARREMYAEAKLEPSMIFTIEPGPYFREDGLAVPEKYRGISVCIEDDILVRENSSYERLSEGIARGTDAVRA